MRYEPPGWGRHSTWLLAGVLLLSVTACAATPPVSSTPATILPTVVTAIATGITPNPTRTRLAVTTSSPTPPRPTVAPPPDTATVVAPTQTQAPVSTELPATATFPSISPADTPTTPPSPTPAVAEGSPTSTVVAVVSRKSPSPMSTIISPAVPITTKTPSPRATVVSSAHTYYLSSASNATNYYCDTDPQWKTLSPKNRKQFPSAEAALAAYPGRKLHQPC